jgi:NhaA family Na+:H+ antiporter
MHMALIGRSRSTFQCFVQSEVSAGILLMGNAAHWQSPETLRGWAIPTATDIAFALGVLSLVASRIPNALKLFLTSLAILDDLGAILIVALFYATDLALLPLALAVAITGVLVLLNRLAVKALPVYLGLGFVLWGGMLFSGIHAILAGVVLALTIPLGTVSGTDVSRSPLCRLENRLNPWVLFVVLPLFGFANAGVKGVALSSMLEPLPLGVVLGLFLGKQAGIIGAVWLSVRILRYRLHHESFIGLLAFADPEREAMTKVAVLTGSLLSALAGVAVLLVRRSPNADQREV